MCFGSSQCGNSVLQCNAAFHNYKMRCSSSEAGILLIKILGVQNQKDSAAAPNQPATQATC